MSERGIPQKVEAFVLGNINSIEQLEVLLLLRKDPDREWDADQVSSALRTNPASAAGRLSDLRSRKLLSKRRDAGQLYYRYSPEAEIGLLVDEVAKFYTTHRHMIIELIYSRPAETIRILADAFRIWKDEE